MRLKKRPKKESLDEKIQFIYWFQSWSWRYI